MSNDLITYEQPLNDHIRVCLRLEHLFLLVINNLYRTDVTSSRVALENLLEALNVIDRPDLKAKLTKALSSHASRLSQLENSPKVDPKKLTVILAELDQLIDCLYGNQDKIAQGLRQNPFLTTIRQTMRNPGGACAFSTPAYHLWLQLPPKKRIAHLNDWYSEFNQLKQAVELLLQLTRGSKPLQPVAAQHGFYQQTLDPTVPCQLVRLAIPISEMAYPEISVGRHRLSIRFIHFDMKARSVQKQENIKFELACCV